MFLTKFLVLWPLKACFIVTVKTNRVYTAEFTTSGVVCRLPQMLWIPSKLIKIKFEKEKPLEIEMTAHPWR